MQMKALAQQKLSFASKQDLKTSGRELTSWLLFQACIFIPTAQSDIYGLKKKKRRHSLDRQICNYNYDNDNALFIIMKLQ